MKTAHPRGGTRPTACGPRPRGGTVSEELPGRRTGVSWRAVPHSQGRDCPRAAQGAPLLPPSDKRVMRLLSEHKL